MPDPSLIDGALVEWGDRLFYPANRIVKSGQQPRLSSLLIRKRANDIRARLAATFVRRAPQVMVKVTGGGRGMKAIAAHFKYISKNGRLAIEDDRGEVMRGKDDLRGLVQDWRLGGTPIEEVGFRREAFNIMLSMPRGIDPLYVMKAAREFAAIELHGHKYVMVLHDHQANPHVHLSVRAESRQGTRLNPRKADLQRWRTTFAEKLRGWGIEAEASSRTVRAQAKRAEPLWKVKARAGGRAGGEEPSPLRENAQSMHGHSARARRVIGLALSASDTREDRTLGQSLLGVLQTPVQEVAPSRDTGPQP